MRIARSTLIGTAVAMALFGRHGAVHAQTSGAATSAKPGDLEEVVVYGIRASLRESLETKKDATGVLDALTAEDVGKFPDKNLAEALQRVPGVVINREFGEGERINLRGTPTTLTKTTLNGHALATADWFILDQLNSTRAFNYLMLPADLIGKVKVLKSAQADVEEGGIGGTVDVETRNPLDLQPFTAYAQVQGAYTEMSGKTDPYATGLISWRDRDDRFGFLLAGIYQERHLRRDGFEVLGYGPASATDPTLVPALIGSALFTQDRIRSGGNFVMQIRPTDQLEIALSGLLSDFSANNLNLNFLADPGRALANGGTLTNTVSDGQGAYVAGRVASLNNGTSDFGVFYDSIARIAKATTRDIDLTTKFTPTADWVLSVRGGYTDATGNTNAQPFVEFGAPTVFTYDLRNGAPQVSFQPNGNGVTVDPKNPSSLIFDFASLHQILNDDREGYVYADAEKKVNSGIFKTLKFGLKRTDHQRDLTFNATTYGGFFKPINTLPASTFAGGQTPSDYANNISVPGSLTQYWTPNQGVVENVLFSELPVSGRVLYPQQSFSAQEKTTGGYVMGEFAGDQWRGNVGVRIARTEQTTSGGVFGNVPGSINSPFGFYLPTTVSRNYTDTLPSLNLAYDLNKEMVVRFAAAKVMARPDYTDIVPRVSLNPGALSGSAGNPQLDPYRATQEDLSFEWYPDKDTAYTLAVYYKDVKSFIVDKPVAEQFPIQSQTPPSALCTPTATTNLFNCPFTINLRSNGGGGKIKGVELALTRPIWRGFGVQANYTYSDASLDSGDPMPGNSKNTFNITGFFENKFLSARLAYSYRSNFFIDFDRTSHRFESALKSLDASVAANVTDYVAVTFDALNLTDAKIVQYADVLSHPRAIYDNGRVYFAGVKVRF
jgi:iron complex outermembrane recepter protein